MSTSSPPAQAGDRASDRAGGHGTAAPVPIKEAAGRLGVSVATLRRWIREGRLHTERVSRPQGYTVLVHIPPHGQVIEQVSAGDHVRDGDHVGKQVGDHVNDHVPIARDLMRAEAMAAYTRSLLEPLVARLAEQEGVIRELERENGRQGAKLERATSMLAAQAEHYAWLGRQARRLQVALVAAGTLVAAGAVAAAGWAR